jgi:hypothetical protein
MDFVTWRYLYHMLLICLLVDAAVVGLLIWAGWHPDKEVKG